MQEHELTEEGYVHCEVARLVLEPYSRANQWAVNRLLFRNVHYHDNPFWEITDKDKKDLRERGYYLDLNTENWLRYDKTLAQVLKEQPIDSLNWEMSCTKGEIIEMHHKASCHRYLLRMSLLDIQRAIMSDFRFGKTELARQIAARIDKLWDETK